MAKTEVEIPGPGQVKPELAVEGRPDLPAFLEEDQRTGKHKLPEGYEWVEIPANSKRQIRLGLRPGDQVIFYLGNVGAILKRGEEGGNERGAYFRFLGIPLPKSLEFREFYSNKIKGLKDVDPEGLKIGYSKGKHAEVHIMGPTGFRAIDGEFLESALSSSACIYLPKIIKAGNMSVQSPDRGQWGVVLGLGVDVDVDKRDIFIKNFNQNAIRIAVPSEEEETEGLRPEAPLPAEIEKSWQEAALEMAEDQFAVFGFRQTGNEIVAAAAFEFQAKIASGAMSSEMFKAMMREVNGIAKSYETQLGRPQEQKLPWPQVAGDMSRNNIAGTAFNATESRIVAAAAYRFRQGIATSQDEGAGFKAMMRKINAAVGKYREKTGKQKT